MTAPPGPEDDYTLTEDLATRARAWLLRQSVTRAGSTGLHVLRARGHARGGEGKGDTITLSVNVRRAGEAHLSRTVPRTSSCDETFDVGEDTASPVGPYEAPFRFTGTIERVELR
ncbi:MAG TPA: hypothetical protein VGY48_16865 [Vicinamibacterales bacterium]|jgi:hypothetical protein|nr:hypothetical protein [Vicinamibacterales bacterium]